MVSAPSPTEPEFIDRVNNPENYPFISNDDGSISTHRMADAEVDGKFIAFPTIHMSPEGELVELEGRAALDKALDMGNFVEFPTAEEASEYAADGYKTEKFNAVAAEQPYVQEEETMTASGLDITLAEEDKFDSDTLASTFIKSKEGFLPTPEWDVNHWTWGYGTAAPHDGGKDSPPPPELTITRVEAQEELIGYVKTEAVYKLKDFEEKYNYNWTDNQIAAITSFMYNGKPRWLRQLTADGTRSNAEIAEAMLLYHNVDDGSGNLVPSPGLIKRRQEEANIFTSGATL